MIFVIMVSALGLMASTAAAQPTGQPERSGFWASFGLGIGSMGFEDHPDDERTGGGTAMVELGGTVNERLLLGGGIHGWAREDSDWDATLALTTVTFMARFYPMIDNGLHLKGGIGFGGIEADFGAVSGSDEGGGAFLGAGFDVPIGQSWNFTPFLTLAAVSTDGGVDANFNQFGLGLTYH